MQVFLSIPSVFLDYHFMDVLEKRFFFGFRKEENKLSSESNLPSVSFAWFVCWFVSGFFFLISYFLPTSG
jgi:hypothetical protein